MDFTTVEVPDEWPHNSNSFVDISTDHNGSSPPVTPKSDTVASNFDQGSSDVSGSMDSHDLSPEKQMSYEELMKKYVQCEEELRTTSLKLQEFEQEIEKLKETEKKESVVLFGEYLRGEREIAQGEIAIRDIAIETERKRVLEVQRQVVDLETELSDLSFKFEHLVNEHEVSRDCLDVSFSEISKLREMLCDCQQNFSIEKTKLVDQIKHSEAEKMEMQRKEVELQAEISALKTDLATRGEHIEALNKDFDKHKLRYDMLMAEKDGVCAEVDNLKAEMRSRDIQIQQMEEQLNQLVYKQTELVSESGNAKNTVEELKAVVKELEIEVELQSKAKKTVEELRATVWEMEKHAELQRNAISQGEEEKREAIRQLCFSLDHYKSGYKQLLWYLSGNNQQHQTTMVV
ncbi:myosin heavy chain, striated protein [Arabidopsis thaliana]|uniref:Myosin heavy chain, striated protein n=1 Tax=Arabidopsis thaliana TaxID=3702 RepID=A0A1P8BB25_ARATH|nr:myosin heavy chain, striated protein [Arabidopsis thaliana]ANM68800.1 myosin heavy chain, striated protein [Arabidopsis thaliana]|eukprot:NP_001330522.1 myosin heavy chain, striated protein [Arabidopsis thaliana]